MAHKRRDQMANDADISVKKEDVVSIKSCALKRFLLTSKKSSNLSQRKFELIKAVSSKLYIQTSG